MTDADEDDVDTSFMDCIARLNRVHNEDWKEGEHLVVSSLGAAVWAALPVMDGDDKWSHLPFDELAPGDEIIYVESAALSGWHRVLTRLGVVFVQKYGLSEPLASDENDERW